MSTGKLNLDILLGKIAEDAISGRKNAVAYQLGDIKRYDVPKQLEEFGIFHAPQSYIYLAEY